MRWPRVAAWIAGSLSAVVVGLRVWDAIDSPPDARLVRRWGERGPRVLCLHGLFASGAFWSRFAEELARDHRVVAPDLLGFGASPKPEDSAYDIAAHLEWLRPVVEEPGEPWIVVGHSMGTPLAVQVALRWPDRVRAVALFNAPVYASAEARQEVFGRQNLLTRAATRSRTLGWAACEASCLIRPVMKRLGPHLRPDLPPAVSADYFRHRWESFDRSLRNLVTDRDLVPDLARVAVPVLVVQGADDPIVDAPDRIAWPPNATHHVQLGEDHTSMFFARPQVSATELRAFEADLGEPQ